MTVPDGTHLPSDDLAMVVYRLNELDKKADRIELLVGRVIEANESRIRKLEEEMVRLSERFTIWQFGQATLTAIAAASAAILGRRIP